MTPERLYRQCIASEQQHEAMGFKTKPCVALTVARRNPPSGDKVRLAGTSGPFGDLLFYRNGELTGRWETAKVKKWLKDNLPEIDFEALD